MSAPPDDDAIAPQSYDLRLLRRLLGYLRPHRARSAAAFVLIVAQAGIDLVGPYLTKIAIDRHIATGDAAGLARVAGLYLLALAAAFVVRFGQNYIMQMTGQRIMQDMRREIFAHLQRLHVGHFDRNPVGRLMTRVTTDVDAVNELFTSGVVTVFGDLFTLVGIMAVMVALDWRLALVTFAVIPLFFVLTNWFRKGARRSFRETRRWVARINAFLQENLSGMSVVQLFRREERNREAFAAINRRHYDANMQAIFYYAVFYPAIELLAAIATALILVYGGGADPRRRAHPRGAGRLHPVLGALLAADLGPLGEVQRAAGRHGGLGAHLRPPRHPGARDEPGPARRARRRSRAA